MTDPETIKRIKTNIFYRSVDSISDYKNFDWHKGKNKMADADKVNSSQALTIDFWGCLKVSPLKDELINLIFNKKEKDWNIKFEFTDKGLLSETRSATQIDVLIKSDNYVIVIESKFTENNGGSCSQVNKTKNGLYQCNGNYETQINPINNIKSKCALSGKGIKYWDYIDELTNFNKKNDYLPCPFKKGEYQWMRNICFADSYAKENKVEAESYLIYLKSNKCSISKKVAQDTFLGGLKNQIKNNMTFKPISYNELLSKCISFLKIDSKEKEIWIELEKWVLDKEQMIN